MKIYMNKAQNKYEEYIREVVKENLELNGVEVTNFVNEADTILRYAEKDDIASKLSYDGVDKKQVYVYSADDNNNLNVYSRANNQDADYFIREVVERKSVACPLSADEVKALAKDILEYVVGRKNRITLVSPLPFNVFYQLIDIHIQATRKNITESTKKTIAGRYGITLTELEMITNEVNAITHYSKESELLAVLRKVKSIWTNLPIITGNITGLIVPNNSDNIIINLFNARISDRFYGFATTDEKKENTKQRFSEHAGNIIKTARNSVFGTNKGFQTYCKPEQGQFGIYGLFIVDNTLKDGEVVIPNPVHMELNCNKRIVMVEGEEQEVVFLHNKRVILIRGTHSAELRKLYRKGVFSNYKIYCGAKGDFENIKEYPDLGDKVVVTRHPITTLICRLKVAGYSDDCSIRVNAKTALALYGDADGDSFVISWSKWTDSLRLHGVAELREFCKAAQINMDTEEYKNDFDINDFICEMEDDKKTCDLKSSNSGLEQSRAKIMTKQWTGAWGSVEMALVQSLIISNVNIDIKMLYAKSLLSQTLVQAKNILAQLQSGEGLSDEVKETIELFALLKGNTLKAAEPVAALLDIEPKEAVRLINEIKGVAVPKELVEDDSDNYDFFEQNQDIIMM